ncbi:MAG: sensor histidine kinase [Candidatus Hodarchaeota archaeon]
MINPVAIVDFITLVSSLVALLILVRGWRYRLGNDSKIVLVVIFIITIFHSFSNILEWTGISSALDPYEDVIQILEPLFWGFFFYSFLQGFRQHELQENEKVLEEKKMFSELLLDLMAHDIENYNQVTLGNLQLLQDFVKNDEEITELTKEAERAIMNSSMLVNNVKILNRLQEGKIETEAILLTPLFESAKEKVQRIYPDLLLMFDLIIEQEDLLVAGHAILENVFINLTANAVRYRKNEQHTIKIEIEVRQDERGVLVSFMDYGIGIEDELKKQIFNRFALTRQERRGSGLGMSISKRIIEALGGKIWVENRPESLTDHSTGSVFKILLKTYVEGETEN